MGSEPTTIAVDATSCRRRVGRAAISLPCAAILVDGKVPCMIEEISLDGARIRISHPLDPGRTLWLKLDAYEVFATTIWGKKHSYGIEFDDPLPKVVLLQIQGHAVNLKHYEMALSERAAKNWVMGGAARPSRSPLIRMLDVLGPKTRHDFAPCIPCETGEPCPVHCGHKQFRRYRKAYRTRAARYFTLAAIVGIIVGVASSYFT